MKVPEKLKVISWQVWAMLIMAVVILVLLFFPKSRGVDKLEERIRQYESYIPRKQAEASEFRAKALKLEKKLRDDSLKNLESEKRYLAKITLLEKKVAEKRRIAQPIIDANDTLRQYQQAMDSVHAAQASRINELKDENRIQQLVCRDLTGVQVKELTIVKDIDSDKDDIIKAQGKVIRKLKAGRTLRNILIPVTAVGTFILTAIIIE